MSDVGNSYQEQAGAQPVVAGAETYLSPEKAIADLEQQLVTTQSDLAAAKRRKSEKDDREKALITIDTQRSTSQQIIDAANALALGWNTQIAANLTSTERDDLTGKFIAADKAVKDADDNFNALNNAVIAALPVVATATENLNKLKSQFTAKQTELRQLGTAAKEPLAKVEKLKGEILSAINTEKWPLAYYKNYRLERTTVEVKDLLDSAATKMTDLKGELEDLTGKIQAAETTVRTEQQKVDEDKLKLREAERRRKEKRDGLETAIATFL